MTVPGIRTPWEEPPAEGEAREVADGVLWMRLPLPMRIDHVNVYALDDGDGWMLVDTGSDSDRGRAIWARLLAGPLADKPVTRVLVTHHHPDHVGLAGWFQHAYGAELIMTRTAWLLARMMTLDVQDRPTPETLAFWRQAGMEPAPYARRKDERPFNYADAIWPMPLGYTRIVQGDRVCAAGRTWDVHMGNGHAPEHATLWSRDDNLVLTGDQLLRSIRPNIGVNAMEPTADPLTEWLEACERMALLAREDHLALGGHGLPFLGLPFRIGQLVENHHRALARLMDWLETPRTAVECFVPLYRRRIDDVAYELALSKARAHCQHLWLTGRATRRAGPDGALLWQRIDSTL